MTNAALDRVFGRDRLKMATGPHVEVYREAAAPGEARRYTKRFLTTAEGDYAQWTEREWRILARLIGHGSRSVPDVVQYDRDVHGTKLVQTYDAGPTVDQWATLLPVLRGGRVHAHVFEDCGHWWALAHHCLAALDEIHTLGLVHLDVKGDNVCIPIGPAEFDPTLAGQRLFPVFRKLALIDFAFSLVAGETLATPLPIGWQQDYDYQSPRLLAALDAGRAGDLKATEALDWRCDMYSLAAMLKRYLPREDVLYDVERACGWTPERYDAARALILRIREAHDSALGPMPHVELMLDTSAQLSTADLAGSLEEGWTLALDAEPREAVPLPLTPVTRLAPPVRVVVPARDEEPDPVPPTRVTGERRTIVVEPEVRAMSRRTTRPHALAAALMIAGVVGAAAYAVPSDTLDRWSDAARVAIASWRAPPGEITSTQTESASAARDASHTKEAPVPMEPATSSAATASMADASAPHASDRPAPIAGNGSVPSEGRSDASPAKHANGRTDGATTRSADASTRATDVGATHNGEVEASASTVAASPSAASLAAEIEAQRLREPARTARDTKASAARPARVARHADRSTRRTSSTPGNSTRLPAKRSSPAHEARKRPQQATPMIASRKPDARNVAIAASSAVAVAVPVPAPVVPLREDPTVPATPATPAATVASPPPATFAPTIAAAAAPVPSSVAAPASAPRSETQSTMTASQATARIAAPAPSGPGMAPIVEASRSYDPSDLPSPLRAPPAVAAMRAAPRESPPSTPHAGGRSLADHARYLMSDVVPGSAAQARPRITRVLDVAAMADEQAQELWIVYAAAGAASHAARNAPAATAATTVEARALHERAREAYRVRRHVPEAFDLALEAFATDPNDADIAGHLAFLHLRVHPAQPERARQLALHAIAARRADDAVARVDDWTTFAIASALTGRTADARHALFTALALSRDVERSCRTAFAAFRVHGERLREPVEALLHRIRMQRRDHVEACAWPGAWTRIAGYR